MSSPDRTAVPDGTAAPADPLPPALRSMWRLCRLGFPPGPGILLAALLLSLLAGLPDALIAVWLALLGSGVLDHDGRRLTIAAVGLAISAAATRGLRGF